MKGMEAVNRGPMGVDLQWGLDFVDTMDWRNSDNAKDGLGSYAELLQWSLKKGLLDQRQVDALARKTSKQAMSSVMAEARKLREAIYRIFSAITHDRKADKGDLEILNEYLARGLSRAQVREEGEAYGWEWRKDVSPDMMLYPVASSSAALLTSHELRRVRECANEEEGCGWLFLDCSKSQSRRWCSMEGCGNRMKFKTYYDRHLRVKQA